MAASDGVLLQEDVLTKVHTWCLAVPCVQERAVRDELVFVAPYDDPHTIAGQGTIGDEILRQVRGEVVYAGSHAQQHPFTPLGYHPVAASSAAHSIFNVHCHV
jgi:threonine dehydratase